MSERYTHDPVYRRLCEQLKALETQEHMIEATIARLERRWVRTIRQQGQIIQSMSHRVGVLQVMEDVKADELRAQMRDLQQGQG